MNTNNIMGGERNYSIDLLKIISMMMVVVLHLNLFGGLNRSARLSDDLAFRLTVQFFERLCFIAVDVFVIISAWFLSASHTYSLKSKRIIRIVVSMFFWYIVASVVAFALGYRPEVKSIILSIPLIGTSYDFIAGYLVMYFLSPYLNKLTSSLTEQSYKKLSAGLFLLFCLLAPVTANGYLGVGKGYNFAWFICIYIIVGYIRKNGFWQKYSWMTYLLLYLSLTVIGIIWHLPMFYISKGYYNDPVIFIASLSCFLLFASFTVRNETMKAIINFFVPLSVAVFFIHANPFIEEWFRSQGLSSKINERALYYVLVIPALTLLIYICCALCEYLRNLLFEKIGINNMMNKLSSSIDKHLNFS